MAKIPVPALAGFPVLLDSRSTTFAEFDAGGAMKRKAYRTGYIFPAAGKFTVTVTPGDDYEVTAADYAAKHLVTVTANMTRQQLATALKPDTDVKWAAGAVTKLDGLLEIRHANVRFIKPNLEVVHKVGRQAGIVVRATGFRVEQATVSGLAAASAGSGKLPGCDLFRVAKGGSLACSGGTFRKLNTFLHVEGGHGGIVVENPTLVDLRAYALYVNGGDAGVSWFKGSVAGPGNEPFFRCMEKDPVGSPTKNVYIGHVTMTRLDPAKKKDGITPRGVKRFAADSCVLETCQFRSGQDKKATGLGNNPDPEDVLLYGCTISNAYAEHKTGSGLGKRIQMIANKFINPQWRPPIGISKCSGAVVKDNVWKGAPASPWTVRRVGTLPDLVEANNVKA